MHRGQLGPFRPHTASPNMVSGKEPPQELGWGAAWRRRPGGKLALADWWGQGSGGPRWGPLSCHSRRSEPPLQHCPVRLGSVQVSFIPAANSRQEENKAPGLEEPGSRAGSGCSRHTRGADLDAC